MESLQELREAMGLSNVPGLVSGISREGSTDIGLNSPGEKFTLKTYTPNASRHICFTSSCQ